jgi:hypothetical protein
MRSTRKRSSDARAPVRRVQSLPAGMLARETLAGEVRTLFLQRVVVARARAPESRRSGTAKRA